MNASTPHDPQTLNDRAADLMTAYLRHRRLSDLERAIGHFKAALAALRPSPSAERSMILANLGAALRELYERTRNGEVLAEAEAIGRAALESDDPYDPNRLTKLGSLAAVLHTRYEVDSDPRILDEEIELLRETVRLGRPNHPHLGGYLSNLTTALHSRLSLPREDADPDELSAQLVEYARAAVATLPANDRGRARATLAMVLRTRHDVTGNLVYLWEAADVARAAIAETPLGHVARPGVLSNAGAILRSLHEHTGTEAAIVEAIGYLRDAVRSSGAADHNRVGYLTNLANALTQLWSATGETAVLVDATVALREALRTVGPNDGRRAMVLTNLARTSLSLAERTRDPEVLKVAENAARAVVALTPQGHREQAPRLSNLAVVLAEQSRRTDNEAEAGKLLRQAVDVARSAVDARSDRAAQARSRTNLAALLQELGERTEDRVVLRQAVEAARTAANDLPSGHPFTFACRVNLAAALWALARHTESRERETAFESSLRIHCDVADAVEAPTALRIRCHRAVARLLSSVPDAARPLAPLEAVEAALELLPQAIAPQLPRADREYAASLLAGFPAQAAAVAASENLPERAVELAEYSRGLVVAEALDTRSGHFATARRRPEARELVDRLDELRRLISKLERDADPNLGRFEPDRVGQGERSRAEADTATRQELQAEWTRLVQELRRIDGLEDFLKPPRLASVLRAAEGGHLVYVYADEERCDALVVSPNHDPAVRLVPLPDANPRTLVDHIQAFHDARAAARAPGAGRTAADAADREMLAELAWAWDAITEPVLRSLGITGTTAAADGQPPRIWWCPIGVLTQLPLHAAGHHMAGGDRSVLDRVVPSYVPSARALLAARAVSSASGSLGAATGDKGGALVVAVPGAAGLPELPGAAAEAELVERLCGDVRRLSNPRRQTVLQALPAYPIVHFACHGEGDPVDPAHGRLILTDHETAPLTVGDINQLTLSGAALAYLSACETTVTSLRLADEAVHLTAAFHLAGYRSVVGTLWEAADTVAYEIAEHFYESVTAEGHMAPDVDRSAHALRDAVLAVREQQHYGRPSLWSGYVHFGI